MILSVARSSTGSTHDFRIGSSLSEFFVLRTPLGTRTAELDTPVLLVDLEAMQRNRRYMAETLAASGVAWRPHVKSHRCPALARTLLTEGAIGVTCATLDEAEQMVASGIPTPLLANLMIGENRAIRVAHLALEGSPIVGCDHFVQAEAIDEACRSAGAICRIVVEVDVGMHRVGVRAGAEARELARGIDRLPNLKLVGVMGYEGHLLMIPDPEEKSRRIREAIGALVHTRDQLLRDGLRCDIVSAGGTGSLLHTPNCDGVTEVQAGGGIFGDPFYTEDCQVSGLTSALTVLTTIVSRPTLDRAVVDAGRKTINGEIRMPTVKDHPDAEVVRLSAEHGVLQLSGESRDLRIGDRIELIVGYSDFTMVLHPGILGLRDEVVEEIFPIGGRFRTGA